MTSIEEELKSLKNDVWNYICQSFMIVNRLRTMSLEEEIKNDEIKKIGKYADKILSQLPPEFKDAMFNDGLLNFVKGMNEIQ